MLRKKLLIAYVRLKAQIENDPPAQCVEALRSYRDRVISALTARWYN